MTKYVRNPYGTVHSVPDDFQLPGEPPAYDGWEEVTETEAPAELLGTEKDPAVHALELHDRAETVVVDQSGPAHEPGDIDGRESNDIQPADAQQVEVPTEQPAAAAVEPAAPEVTA